MVRIVERASNWLDAGTLLFTAEALLQTAIITSSPGISDYYVDLAFTANKVITASMVAHSVFRTLKQDRDETRGSLDNHCVRMAGSFLYRHMNISTICGLFRGKESLLSGVCSIAFATAVRQVLHEGAKDPPPNPQILPV